MLKRFLSMLLCLALLCGAALAEGLELELSENTGVELELAEDAGLEPGLPEDVGAVEDGLELSLPEDLELALPEPETDGGEASDMPVANDGEAEGEAAEHSTKVIVLDNEDRTESLGIDEENTDYTINVKGDCTYNGSIWCIDNGSTLTITGGGKLIVKGIIVTNTLLVIDGVTLTCGPIWGHDDLIIRNSTVEIPEPDSDDYRMCIQNMESNSDYTPSLTIENSTINAAGSVEAYGMVSIVNSSIEALMHPSSGGVSGKKMLINHSRIRVVTSDGEETWWDLISARDGLILKDVQCFMKRTTGDPYEELPLTLQDDGTYKPGYFSSVEWLVTPVEPLPKIESISIDNGALGKNPKLLVGAKATFKAKVSPAKADAKAIKWSVDNTKYAIISQDGVLKAKANGAGQTVTVTAKATDGSGVKATKKVKIVGKVTKITLKPNSKTVKVGKKLTIKATVTVQKGGSKALQWKVSNTKYATISQKGVLTAKKAGKGKTVTVTATAKDGGGTKASVKIKIE